jgi:hypothetical protein
MNAPEHESSPVPGLQMERNSLYREFVAEREEIQRHKWLESEKAGRDIGFEAALVSWIVHHRAQWRRERRQAMA